MASPGRDERLRMYDEAIVQLLRSIASEEESMASLLKTESDKMAVFTGSELDFPTLPSTTEIIRYNQTLIHLLDSVLMSKWLSMKKLDMVLLHRTAGSAVEPDEDMRAADDAEEPGIDY